MESSSRPTTPDVDVDAHPQDPPLQATPLAVPPGAPSGLASALFILPELLIISESKAVPICTCCKGLSGVAPSSSWLLFSKLLINRDTYRGLQTVNTLEDLHKIAGPLTLLPGHCALTV